MTRLDVALPLLLLVGCTSSDHQATDASTTADAASDEASRDDVGADAGSTDAAGGEPGDTSIPFRINVILAQDLNPTAPGTVAIVTWALEGVDLDRAEIRYGLTTAYDLAAPVDLGVEEYRTVLLGMKPGREYHFQIVAESDGQVFASEDGTLETGPASNLVNVTSTILNPELHEKGYILSTQLAGTPSDYQFDTGSMVFVLDPDGDIVWWYQSRVGRTSRAHLSSDGKFIWLVPDRGSTDYDAIERVSVDTLESTLFEAAASHDAIPLDNGSLAYIDYGEEDCGSVFELAADGTRTEIFEPSDTLPGLVPPACHTNAIRYYEDEGLFSVGDLNNGIFIIDRQGELLWRLDDIVSHETWGAEQHGHQLLADSMLLFANQGGEDQRSAVVEYSLSSGEELFRYESESSSAFLGDVQRLPGGNTLVTYSVAGVIHEVTPNKELVMTARGSIFGYAVFHPSLYPDRSAE